MADLDPTPLARAAEGSTASWLDWNTRFKAGEAMEPGHLHNARAVLSAAVDVDELAQVLAQHHAAWNFDANRGECSCGVWPQGVGLTQAHHQAAVVRAYLHGEARP